MVRPADVVTGVERRFESPLHETRTAAILGIALGVTFGACFVTGLLSHLIQHPASWFHWPTHPAGLYRVTQGVHVTTGFVSIPILLAKLWTVFPRFWSWPPARNVAHAVERITLLPLVGGGVFLLYSGVANVARFYPYPFFFPTAHYWVAWMTIGAMIAHIGAKASLTRDAALPRRPDPDAEWPAAPARDRRAFLTGVAATSALLGLATVREHRRPPQLGRGAGAAAPPSARRAYRSTRPRSGRAAARPAGPTTASSSRGRWTSGSRSASTSCRRCRSRRSISPSRAWRAGAVRPAWTGVAVRDLLDAGRGRRRHGRGALVGATGALPGSLLSRLTPTTATRSWPSAWPGNTRHRPWLPAAPHRSEPSGRDADQVGRATGRDHVSAGPGSPAVVTVAPSSGSRRPSAGSSSALRSSAFAAPRGRSRRTSRAGSSAGPCPRLPVAADRRAGRHAARPRDPRPGAGPRSVGARHDRPAHHRGVALRAGLRPAGHQPVAPPPQLRPRPARLHRRDMGDGRLAIAIVHSSGGAAGWSTSDRAKRRSMSRVVCPPRLRRTISGAPSPRTAWRVGSPVSRGPESVESCCRRSRAARSSCPFCTRPGPCPRTDSPWTLGPTGHRHVRGLAGSRRCAPLHHGPRGGLEATISSVARPERRSSIRRAPEGG